MRIIFVIIVLALFPNTNMLAQSTTNQTSGAVEETVVTPVLILNDPGMRDPDDQCIWIHPTDAAQSTIIISDKAKKDLIVTDHSGQQHSDSVRRWQAWEHRHSL